MAANGDSCNGWLVHDSCMHWIAIVCLWILLVLLILLWVWLYWYCCCRTKKGKNRFVGYDSYAQTEDYGCESETTTVYQNVVVDRDRDGDVDMAVQVDQPMSCAQCDAMLHRRRHMYASATQTIHKEERPKTPVAALAPAPVFVSKVPSRTPSPEPVVISSDSEPEDTSEPGPPINCELVDYGRNHVDISWDPPVNGGPYNYYVIEKKERTSHWVDHTEVDKNAPTHLKISKLRAGDKYAFRVRAVNSTLGRGKQSGPSNIIGPVVCKPKIEKQPPLRRRTPSPPKAAPHRRRSSVPKRRPTVVKRPKSMSPPPKPAAPARRNSDPPAVKPKKKSNRKKKVAPPPGWKPHQQLPGQPKVVGM